MLGSHILGLPLPWRRSVFTLSEPVCCLFASKITYPWSVRVIHFSRPFKYTHNPRTVTTEACIFILIPKYHIYVLEMFIVKYPIVTNVKEVCVSLFYSLSNPRDFPTLLSPASLIYNQWKVTRPYVSSFNYNVLKSCQTTILQSIFSICWDFAS